MSEELKRLRQDLIDKYLTPHNEQIERTGDIVDRVALEKLILLVVLAVLTIAANNKLLTGEFDWITLGATLGLDLTAIKLKWSDFTDLYKFRFGSMKKLKRTSDMFKSLLMGLDQDEGKRRVNTLKAIQKFVGITRIISTLEPWLDKEYPAKINTLFGNTQSIMNLVSTGLEDLNFQSNLDAIKIGV
jgi:hypothetical protein